MGMLTDYVDFADSCHSAAQCVNPCFTNCSSGCLICLDKQYHKGQQRIHDCEKRCGTYVCHYLFKFFVEMRLLCKEVSPLNDSLKVLSMGCGPCSELFAVEEMMAKQFEEYRIDFVGIDLSDKWRLFHAEIDRLIAVHQKPINTRFIVGDATSELSQLLEEEFDIIVLNYFLSDYRKLHSRSILPVRQFCHLLYHTVIDRMPINAYILLNDMNHNDSRDCFDALIHEIKRRKIVKKFRFHKPLEVLDKYTPSYSKRGDPSIRINSKYTTRNFIRAYSPRTDCSSAQVLIEVR